MLHGVLNSSLSGITGFVSTKPSLSAFIPSCVFDLDATMAASYGGTGQVWANLIPAPADGSVRAAYDVNLGTSSSPSTDDPTFTGSAGTPSAYFLMDGSDLFQIPVNTSFLKALQKTTGGSNLWVMIAFRFVSSGATQVLMSTSSASTQVGLRITVSSAGAIQFQLRGDTVNVASSSASLPTLVNGTDYIYFASYDGTTLRQALNSVYAVEEALSRNTCVSDPAGLFTIGGYPNGGSKMASGTRVYAAAGGNSTLSNADILSIAGVVSQRHGLGFGIFPRASDISSLVGSAKLELDATLADSATAGSQIFYNRILNGMPSMLLGSSTLSQTTDPVFVGTSGDSGSYYLFDGTQWFTAISNDNYVNGLHRTDSGRVAGTHIIHVFYNDPADETQYFFSTRTSTTPGLEFLVYGDTVEIRQSGDGTTLSKAFGIFDRTQGQDLIFGWGIDTDGTCRIWPGTALGQDTSISFNAGTSNAGAAMKLMASGAGSSDVVNGTKLYQAYSVNKLLTDAEFLALANNMKAHRNNAAIMGFGHAVVTCGQSNGRRLGYYGASTMLPEINGTLSNYSLVNGATAGSYLLKSNAGSSTLYWYDDATNTYSGDCWPAFVRVCDGVEASGGGVAAFIWDQGEADSVSIGTNASLRAQYKAALLTVFIRMRTDYGAAPVFIAPIGRRGDATNIVGYQAVREVQQELAGQYDWIYLLPEKFTEGDDGGAHLDTAGYQNYAAKVGRRIAKTLGGSVSGGVDGPNITGAIRSLNTITLTITHDTGGTDFTPTTGIEGFRYFDGSGSEISVASAVRFDASTVVLTLASAPATAGTLYYGYGSMNGITRTNLIKDNSSHAMPLRAGKFYV